MPFQRPSLAEIKSRTEASRLGLGALLRRSFLKVFARVVAGGSHLLHGHLDWASRQVLPDTADAEHLARWSSIWGVTRKTAAYAEGSVIFEGEDGVTIPAGTLIQRADGVRYATDNDVLISAGIAIAPVTAVLAGEAGNEEEGVDVAMVSPIAGVQASAEIAAGGFAGGADAESDADLRARLLLRIQQPPHGGAGFDYVAWALAVAGVTRAWVLPGWTGPGTVGLTFVMDGQVGSIFPSNDKVQEVEAYVEERRPVTADIVVFAPTAKNLNPTIQLTPNTAEVRAAVEASLDSLLRRTAVPGGTMLLSQLREAISIAAGESNNVLVSPVADVVSAPHELLVRGTVIWS
jgi:uncharacterized phage protein gp47/JayE